MKVGIFGIGACGSNIAELGDKKGYTTAIMNTSQEDLDSISLVKNKLLLGEQGGCGKDRAIGKSEVKSHYKSIIQFVKTKFYDCDIIYITFSSGGGTGSGMSPIIIDMLTKMIPDKKFAAIAVIPALSETPVAQFNTYECLEELSSIDVPTLIVDNEKFKEHKSKMSKADLYNGVNSHVIASLDVVYNRERKSSKYGNMDSKDLSKLMFTPGCMSITVTVMNQINDSETIAEALDSSWNSSIFASLQYDKVIKRSGYIFELQEEATKFIDYDIFHKNIGQPIETFEGYYSADDNKNYIVSILTGLSFPEDRLKLVMDSVESAKGKFKKREKISLFNDEDVNIDWFKEERKEVKKTKPSIFGGNDDSEVKSEDIDLEALFSNY